MSLQIETLRDSHQDDMQLLHERMASIIGRKDAQIHSLTEQLAQMHKRFVSFDDLFARERQTLLSVCDD